MKKIIFLAFLLAPFTALAVGGGGGGSIPECSQDTWICTEWSECSASGEQKRTCSLSFDCPSADTLRPQETQSCSPPCTEDKWTCTEWSECRESGKQTRECELIDDCSRVSNIPPITARECTPETQEPKPASRNPFEPIQRQETEPTSRPVPTATAEKKIVCREDRWDCAEWSGECDIYGNHKRTCKMTLDCPGAETPPPQFYKRCEKLQCGDKPTMKERVLCRLNLSPAGLTREYEIQYLPEECRILAYADRCIQRYKSYKPCWEKPIGQARSICAMGVLGLGQGAAKTMSDCVQSGKDKAQCQAEHREKVYELIKFRFYDLEERAEDLIEKGADKNLIADFVVFITESKDRFSKAQTKEERKQIILDVRTGWKKFIEKIKTKLQ